MNDKDVVPQLYKDIKETYQDEIATNPKIKMILKKIDYGKATYEDLYDYANELGHCLEKAFAKNVSKDVLPNGTMYYNIAQRLVSPMIATNYNNIAKKCETVQNSLNKKANIGLKGIKPPYREEKTRGIINYVSSAEYKNIEKSFLDSLSTNTRSVVDSSVKENVEYHYQSGLSPKIIRRTVGKCCEWCSNLAGVYNYADVKKTGNNVYRRHANCRCQVIYDPSDGSKKIQDAWTKQWSKKVDIEKRLQSMLPKEYIGKDVTKEYYGTAKTKGKVIINPGYKKNIHENEIEVANIISKTFGGDVTLLNEVHQQGIKTPDFIWNKKKWELKTLTTEKAADSAVRKALKQIQDNGGIILDYRTRNITLDVLMSIVDNRMKRNKQSQADIMILLKDNVIKIFRYKK